RERGEAEAERGLHLAGEVGVFALGGVVAHGDGAVADVEVRGHAVNEVGDEPGGGDEYVFVAPAGGHGEGERAGVGLFHAEGGLGGEATPVAVVGDEAFVGLVVGHLEAEHGAVALEGGRDPGGGVEQGLYLTGFVDEHEDGVVFLGVAVGGHGEPGEGRAGFAGAAILHVAAGEVAVGVHGALVPVED